MSQSTNFARLQSLYDQLPVKTLHTGRVAGDKPGVLANDIQVCRLRDNPAGELYGEVFVEAINALPSLLKLQHAPEQSAGAAQEPKADENSPLRQQVESAITQTLSMLPGFKAATSALSAKLIFAAVEPWLAGGREAISAAPAPIAPQPTAKAGDDLQQARLDAVMDFCTFMLAKGEGESLPNEYALEQLVNDWDKAHNSAAGGEP